MCLGVDHHRSELDHLEVPAVPSDPVLPEEHRSAVELHRNSHRHHDGGDDQHDQCGSEPVDDVLDHPGNAIEDRLRQPQHRKAVDRRDVESWSGDLHQPRVDGQFSVEALEIPGELTKTPVRPTGRVAHRNDMELARTSDPRGRVEVAKNGNPEDVGLAVQALSGRRARSRTSQPLNRSRRARSIRPAADSGVPTTSVGCTNRPLARFACNHLRRANRPAKDNAPASGSSPNTHGRSALSSIARLTSPSTTADVTKALISLLNSSDPWPSTRGSHARMTNRHPAVRIAITIPSHGEITPPNLGCEVAQAEHVADADHHRDCDEVADHHRSREACLPAGTVHCRPGRCGGVRVADRSRRRRMPESARGLLIGLPRARMRCPEMRCHLVSPIDRRAGVIPSPTAHAT